jgi:two-component system phosphate regulon sensor histidine kinase PhoR
VKDLKFSAKRVTEIYNNNGIDKSAIQQKCTPDVKIEKIGSWIF